jgi:hypothetical protein
LPAAGAAILALVFFIRQDQNAPMTEKTLGRPSGYTKERAKRICELIEEGLTLTAISRMEDMPKLSTMYLWQDEHPEFMEAYSRARNRKADTIVDLIQEEAYSSHDPQIGRLRIDALKWTASKLAPKRYGDKIEVEQSGQQNFKISFAVPERDTRDSLKELSAPVSRLTDAPIEAEIVDSE